MARLSRVWSLTVLSALMFAASGQAQAISLPVTFEGVVDDVSCHPTLICEANVGDTVEGFITDVPTGPSGNILASITFIETDFTWDMTASPPGYPTIVTATDELVEFAYFDAVVIELISLDLVSNRWRFHNDVIAGGMSGPLTSVVPEPTAGPLIAIGLLALGYSGRRRRTRC